MRVLCIEDEPTARELVIGGLTRRGFSVEAVPTAAKGVERACNGSYDALVIDVMLPDGEGFELLQRIRSEGVETPALFLTARGDVQDRIQGFRVGADDYLPKPFSLAELEARVRAITRRRGAAADVLRAADLELDATAKIVTRDGRTIELPPKPLAILELLLRNAGRVVSHAAIVERVWGWGAEVRPNTLAVQISYLRDHVDRGFASRLIHTRPGVGYVLEDRRDTPSPVDAH